MEMFRYLLPAVVSLTTSALLTAQPPPKKPVIVPENRPERIEFRPYKAVHVLAIGINGYQAADYWQLEAAEADARAVAAIFRDRYHFKVAEPLLGAKATKTAILSALNQYR